MTSTKSTKYKFEGKVALVTGSSSGIGASIAYQLACYGASVVIHGRDFKTLAEVGQKIKQDTDIIPFEILGDMLNENTPTKLITQTIAKFGQLDFLVNNAGGSTPNEELENNPELLEAFDNVMRLNLRSVLEMIQLAVPYLKKTKGNIVNISSIDAIRPCGLIYSTSKAALDMVTKISAQQLGPLGIRVNSVK